MAKNDTPPRTPETDEQLDRAIMLLGSRTKVEATTKVRAEIKALVGAYPTQAQAATWKSQLKAKRKLRKGQTEAEAS